MISHGRLTRLFLNALMPSKSPHIVLCRLLLKQSDDVRVSARSKREAVNFWKRLQLQHPAARDKLVAFWKRAYPHDTLDSFWKRGVPAGRGLQAFWKRFVEIANDDDDLSAILSAMTGLQGHAAGKKNVHPARQQQQRRAKEMSARRPEFNPTGW